MSLLDQYGHEFISLFYPEQIENMEVQFRNLSLKAVESGNPFAKSHIVDDEKNYTALIYALDKMTNDSRSKIFLDIMAKKPFVRAKFDKIIPIATDVDLILLSKRCNATQIEKFFEEKINNTRRNIEKGIMEVYQPYMNFVFNKYVPFDLIQIMGSEIDDCIDISPQTDTITCMRRVSETFHTWIYL